MKIMRSFIRYMVAASVIAVVAPLVAMQNKPAAANKAGTRTQEVIDAFAAAREANASPGEAMSREFYGLILEKCYEQTLLDFPVRPVFQYMLTATDINYARDLIGQLVAMRLDKQSLMPYLQLGQLHSSLEQASLYCKKQVSRALAQLLIKYSGQWFRKEHCQSLELWNRIAEVVFARLVDQKQITAGQAALYMHGVITLLATKPLSHKAREARSLLADFFAYTAPLQQTETKNLEQLLKNCVAIAECNTIAQSAEIIAHAILLQARYDRTRKEILIGYMAPTATQALQSLSPASQLMAASDYDGIAEQEFIALTQKRMIVSKVLQDLGVTIAQAQRLLGKPATAHDLIARKNFIKVLLQKVVQEAEDQPGSASHSAQHSRQSSLDGEWPLEIDNQEDVAGDLQFQFDDL